MIINVVEISITIIYFDYYQYYYYYYYDECITIAITIVIPTYNYHNLAGARAHGRPSQAAGKGIPTMSYALQSLTFPLPGLMV